MTSPDPAAENGSPAEGARLKDKGNVLFKKGDYIAALQKYTQGTQPRKPREHFIIANE